MRRRISSIVAEAEGAPAAVIALAGHAHPLKALLRFRPAIWKGCQENDNVIVAMLAVEDQTTRAQQLLAHAAAQVDL